MSKYLIIFLSVVALAFPQKGMAENDLDAMLDGILAGMESAPDFDSMLSAMEVSANHAHSQELSIASIAEEMNLSSTLDYLDYLYSTPLPSYNTTNSLSHGNSWLNMNGAQLPIVGRLSSRFGYRPRFGRMHKGVDITLQIGDTVCSAMAGIVSRVANDPRGYGLFVCIKHDNGMETRYAHLSRQLVLPGMRIMAGEPVGLGGSTGNSTGPHLHFETRLNGEAVDPTTMFDFSMPGGAFPYRTLADLDKKNPRLSQTDTDKSPGMSSGTSDSGNRKSTYIVRLGDTVETIAKKNGVSVLSLCRLNMISSTDILKPGRMIKLR